MQWPRWNRAHKASHDSQDKVLKFFNQITLKTRTSGHRYPSIIERSELGGSWRRLSEKKTFLANQGFPYHKKIKQRNAGGNKDLRACWQLTATCARPSDASIATASSLFIGVLSYCAQRLQISRTLAELYWIHRRRPHDCAAAYSSAARDQRQSF